MIDLNLQEIYEERYEPNEEYLGRDKKINKIDPLVSVCIATYQHVDYIEECLEGILMQETEFQYEIIIGEDESTDGTREICKKYAEKYPDKIRLFLRDRQTSCIFNENGDRIYGFNGKWARKSARGEYIALCDGDDYWTDPLKLQKQVDFMEVNRDYTLCVGGYETKNENSKNMKKIIKIVNDPDKDYGYSFTLNDITKGWITKVLTSVIRVNAIRDIDFSRFKNFRDVHLFYHLLTKGKGFYFTDVFGVYRIHDEGVFSSETNRNRYIDHYFIYKDIYIVYNTDPARIKFMGAIKKIFRERLSLDQTGLNYFILTIDILKLIKNPMEFLSFIKSLIPIINKYDFRSS